MEPEFVGSICSTTRLVRLFSWQGRIVMLISAAIGLSTAMLILPRPGPALAFVAARCWPSIHVVARRASVSPARSRQELLAKQLRATNASAPLRVSRRTALFQAFIASTQGHEPAGELVCRSFIATQEDGDGRCCSPALVPSTISDAPHRSIFSSLLSPQIQSQTAEQEHV
ncbi:hypothetical protein IF803_35485 [Bradyrhizobium sp. UFLA06-06]